MAHAHRLDQRGTGDGSSARAIDHDLDLIQLAPGQVASVEQARRRNDRGAVLVVVKNRYVHQFLQALLDDETFRRPDIFKIDAAKRGPEITHSVDEFIRVFGVHFEID